MGKQEKIVHTKKRLGRPPTGHRFRETIPVRLTPEASDAIDTWIARQPKPMSRSEAIRTLIDRGLKRR
jgi:hypothetical protein